MHGRLCEAGKNGIVLELPSCYAAVVILGSHLPEVGDELSGHFEQNGVMTIENVTQHETFVGLISCVSKSKDTVKQFVAGN